MAGELTYWNGTNVAVNTAGTSGQAAISGGSGAPTFGTLGVSGGGTGNASFTAYAVICGGTTSTGALQSIASVGTSGQVLTSNGAGALPTFQGSPGSRVCFSAYLASSITNTTGDGTQYLCIYDSVSVNAGSGYNVSTGLFTAPVTGNYLFSFSTRITTSSNISTGGAYVNYLYINSANANKLFGTNRPDTGAATCNTSGSVYSVIVPLTASDTIGIIYALTTDALTKNTTITGDATNRPNIFCGTLL